MGRKNKRNERWLGEPLDLTPADIEKQQRESRARHIALSRQRSTGSTVRELHEIEAERAKRQHNARINNGIDWSVCLVPGCGEEITIHPRGKYAPSARDHSTSLPLCYWHLAVAHQQGQRFSRDELLIQASAKVLEWKRLELVRLEEESTKAWREKRDGFIYYVRVNGLIKAGWTRDLYDRLRAYGPDVEILAHYPATRDDETNLHRQLRPFLAKGREWYHDCKALADFVEKAVKEHGPPTVTPIWSEPKEVIRPRKRSA